MEIKNQQEEQIAEENKVTDELAEAIELFSNRAHLFVNGDKAFEDGKKYFERKLKPYKYLSQNWVRVCAENKYRHHYKQKQSYVQFWLEPTRRSGVMHKTLILNYVKSKLGMLYWIDNGADAEAIVILKSHVVERFIERALNMPKWESVEIPRDEFFREIIDRLMANHELNPISTMPYYDPETDTAYAEMDGGFLVGTIRMASKDGEEESEPRKPIIFFKTFLSYNEISEKRMERILELHQRRKERHAEIKAQRERT